MPRPPRRLLVVPAAGLGTRLATGIPKLLVRVNGRPMLDHILDRYRAFVRRVIVVVHPTFAGAVADHARSTASGIELVIQPTPTGMLDASLVPHRAVRESAASHVWITWCDQVAIRAETVARLAETSSSHPGALLVMPTLRRREPYIHLERDHQRRIVRILHRREGDVMPDVGESDMGLFSLSRDAYLDHLAAFADEANMGAMTRERNFLPFIPWAAARGEVITFPGLDEMEGVGINTLAELAAIESYLSGRDPAATG